MPRYAVLRHDSPRGLHWDFLLESGPVLRSWALPQPPAAASEMAATALADHRLAYLDYEGPVSGGRGTVSCWDRGTYTVAAEGEGELVVVLMGSRFCGRVELRREPGDPQSWRVAFR